MTFARIYYPATMLFLVFLLALPVKGEAQDSDLSPTFTREQLAQMLAPIALYPDALLTQVLMASTYPIEVVEADRWVKKFPDLQDENLDTALQVMDWDPSIKALCHFPTVLALMSERIGETTNIGNAFLVQEQDVMAMVQELRSRAYEHGNLNSSAEQKVIVEKETIIIEPVDPRVVYVPYYDPFNIYGPWWYPAYPPYYWGPSREAIGMGISYWPGSFFNFTFGTWCYVDWPRRYIHIDVYKRPRYVRRDRWIVKSGHWNHVPYHRRGVAYRDKVTARKYGQYPYRIRTFDRDIRGFPDQRDLDRIRIDRNRQELDRIDRERQVLDRVEQERRRRERTEIKRQPRLRAEQPRQPRRPEQAGRSPQRSDQARQWRERVEQRRQIQERSESNIFNRVDEGRRERAYSRRGSMSRKGRQGVDVRNRNPGISGGADRDYQGRGGRGGHGGQNRRQR